MSLEDNVKCIPTSHVSLAAPAPVEHALNIATTLSSPALSEQGSLGTRSYISDILKQAEEAVRRGEEPCAAVAAAGRTTYIEGESRRLQYCKLKGGKYYALVNFDDREDVVGEGGQENCHVVHIDEAANLARYPVVRVSHELCEDLLQMTPEEFHKARDQCANDEVGARVLVIVFAC